MERGEARRVAWSVLGQEDRASVRTPVLWRVKTTFNAREIDLIAWERPSRFAAQQGKDEGPSECTISLKRGWNL